MEHWQSKPRNIIVSKRQGTNHDENIAVFTDGQYTTVAHIKNNTQVRTLAIDFDKGSLQIEIAGTHVVPEFGTAVFVTILVIAIIGIIVVSRKFNGISSIIQKR